MPSRSPNEGGSSANTTDTETWSSGAASSGSLNWDGGTRFPPNSLALAILAEVKDRQKDRRETDASRTEELVREARAGGQNGYEPVE
jgi:hypothetical protein